MANMESRNKKKGDGDVGAGTANSSVCVATSYTSVDSVSSSSFTCSTVTSKKEFLDGRLTQTGAQDTSQERNYFDQEGNRGKNRLEQTGSDGVGTGDRTTCGVQDSSNRGNYCREGNLRKSSTPMGTPSTGVFLRRGHERDLSAPSAFSSAQSEGQMGNSRTSTAPCDMGKFPSHYSIAARQKPKSGGILNIFRWFRNRDKKKSGSVDRISINSSGSLSSLSSNTSSFAYIPIMRSKSAGNQKELKTKVDSQLGTSRKYKLFSKESSLSRLRSDSKGSQGDSRFSGISGSSESSARESSSRPHSFRKKRPAPQPPGSPKNSETGSLKSCTSLPSRDLRPATDNAEEVPEGRRLQKSKSEGLICRKMKRRAPPPPVQAVAQRFDTTGSEKGSKPQSGTSTDSTGRKTSVSSVSSLSQSLSSISTLQSHSSSAVSVGLTDSPFSTNSVLQGTIKSSSSSCVSDDSKSTLTPRPWYKRKKKETDKDSKSSMKKEKIYDTWMPEIQFSRKLNLTGTFQRSKCDKNEGPNSSTKTKEEEKKEKRQSQVSLLASISELDRAASEQMQREMEAKKAKKASYDNKFYKASEPLFLKQRDFLPSQQEHSNDAPEGSSARLWTAGRDDVQDNFHKSNPVNTLPQSYSKQSTLRVEERNSNSNHSSADNCTTDDVRLNFESFRNSFEGDSLPDLFTGRPEPPTSPNRSRASPLQRAVIDAELFYQLAKDSRTSVDTKNKPSSNTSSPLESRKQTRDEEPEHESTESDIPDLFGQFRRQSKNFGLRMNNFFSPDVSTILEASESMTSTATTPGDEIYEDLSMPMSVAGRRKTDSFHEELVSEVNYDFRMTSNTADIMQELADVKREIENIRREEEEARRDSERKKANKIRADMAFFKDRQTFDFWQNAAGQAGSTGTGVTPPIPIEITENSERKLKWVCEMCTLINLPWRLQCEACMTRRPANPKRVDEDGKSVSSDHPSSPLTGTSESPVTVIHEDGANVPDNVPTGAERGDAEGLSPLDDPLGKRRKDINWEVELQKYFRTFDEHVRHTGDATDGREQASANATALEIDALYGKISKASKKAVSASASGSEDKGKGAKPKTKFGTAFSEEEIRTSYEIAKKKQNSSENSAAQIDVEEVRKLRLARYQEKNSPEGLNSESNSVEQEVKKNTKEKKKHKNKQKHENKTDEGESKKEETTNTNNDVNHTEMHLTNGEEGTKDEDADKTFYAKSYRKPQVLKPSGAVRSAISVFNQMDQIYQASKEKPKVTRRRSFGNVSGRAQLFEKMNSGSNSPELPRAQVVPEVPKPYQKVEILKDKDIVSAIAKFDEMAAMAEIEKIEKCRVKNEATKKKPWTSGSSSAINQTPSSPTTSRASATTNTSPQGNHINPSAADNAEGLIKGGILYTEQRKRSMSIGSGTFELIEAKDFDYIEAQHSESLLTTSSGIAELIEASAAMAVPPRPTSPLPEPLAQQSSLSNTVALVSQSESVGEWKRDIEKKELERLSHQLTVPDGIASFKANLKVEEQSLGQTNTLNINRLLRKLEKAISQGNHAKAAQLAHELAELKISCSVIRKRGNEAKNGREKQPSLPPSPSLPSPPPSKRPTTLNYKENNMLPPPNKSAEFVEATTPSNVSECFYDASDMFENETMDSYEHMVYVNDTTFQVIPPPSNFTSVMPKKEQQQQPNNSQAKPADSTSSSTPAASSVQKASPTPNKREVRVDPARREVKSDTISKLDESIVDEKEVSTAALPFRVKMYVEDKNSHQGPISLFVTSAMTVGELREKVCQDFGFPPHVQRWILGKRLADDDSCSLEHHKVTTEGCPIFLYLVAPEPEVQKKSQNKKEYAPVENVAVSSPYSAKKHYSPYSPVGSTRDEICEAIYENIGADMSESYSSVRNEPTPVRPPEHRRVQEANYAPLQSANQPQVNGVTEAVRTTYLNSSNNRVYQEQSIHRVQQVEANQPTRKVEKEAATQQKTKKRETTEMTIQLQTPQQQPPKEQETSVSNPIFQAALQTKLELTPEKQEQIKFMPKQQPNVAQVHRVQQSQTAQIVSSTPLVAESVPPTSIAQQVKQNQPKTKKMPHTQKEGTPKSPKQNPKERKTQATPANDPNLSQAQALEIPVRKDPQSDAVKHQHPPTREEPAPETSSSNMKVHGWMCPTCTLVNRWDRPGCEACATERPGAAPQGNNNSAEKGPGLGAVMTALESQGFVPNPEPFECRICFIDFDVGEGAVLRDCLHTFCLECLANAIKYSDTAAVKCPYRDNQYSCDSSLQDREVKALVTPQEYEKHLAKSVKQAEGAMENVYHCKTPDCPGFCQFEDNVNVFHCDVCNKVNCLTCQAQHNGVSCKEYQDDLANKVDEAAMKTKKFFDDMIRRGDGLPCPKCSVMLVRKWGCDWMRCPMCRTEICWVTRGPRWGPGGPGDVSGGCKCGIRGQKCHPKCTYCH